MTLLESLPPWRVRRRTQFMRVFRKSEAESAAAWLVLYAYETDPERWRPIEKAKLATFFRACFKHPELGPILANPFLNLTRGFALLAQGGFLRETETVFEVTDAFVERAFLAGHDLHSPIQRLALVLATHPREARMVFDAVLDRGRP